MKITPEKHHYQFETDLKVPRVGLMMVGWGGNNGTTVTAGILANKLNIKWQTKTGEKLPNYYGSLTQVRIGARCVCAFV